MSSLPLYRTSAHVFLSHDKRVMKAVLRAHQVELHPPARALSQVRQITKQEGLRWRRHRGERLEAPCATARPSQKHRHLWYSRESLRPLRNSPAQSEAHAILRYSDMHALRHLYTLVQLARLLQRPGAPSVENTSIPGLQAGSLINLKPEHTTHKSATL